VHGYVHAMNDLRSLAAHALAVALTCGALCSACAAARDDMDSSRDTTDAGDGELRPRVDPSVPPIADRSALTDWLAQRYYLNWTCDAAPHASRAAVHSRMRACRNTTLEHPPASGDYHVGAAAVAELLDASDTLIGHAALVRALPDPGATGWYFYERFTPGTSTPALLALEADGTYADGPGDWGGNAQTICASCHASATRDFVYDPAQ
jgi:hypothetical protein